MADMGFWGQSRREENHDKWEKQNAKQAVRAKAREAQRKAIEKEQKAKRESARRQRNNRREY
jgi:hypothetical protein